MVRRSYGQHLVWVLSAALGLAVTANAATVTKQVYVTFDGVLDGGTYTLGPGEIDNSTTFGPSGSVSISGGIADIPGDVDGASGFYFNGVLLGLGSLTAQNWISEALFSPDVPAADQPTIAASGRNPEPGNHILDIQGDTFLRYDGFGFDPKGFSTGYYDGSNELFTGAPEPTVNQLNHVGLVWDAAATSLEGFLNGVSIGVTDQNAFDVSSPNVGYGFFARFFNRAVDGKLDAVAFSTYEGAFDPASDFQLPVVPEPTSLALLAIAAGALAVIRRK